ncbi:ESPR-type extended signal peptide-containing protein [uncultured Dialister sp.]|uniref:ESPR-type extended signal peptide-containing protein n=1 Tax=uncultured Dialister sp. TaxID=278064 RepID=UPI0025D08ACC|nr:ESPR-type extended signal peptide-containing protein [uncultured Dialister sp.]
MNKIYKVIWSKAKHTYVVASEIAKGHTKGETTGKGLKRLAAALLVAAALLSPNFAWAADTTKVEPAPDGSATAVEVYTKEEANNAFATIENVSTLGHTVNTLSSELDTLSTLVNTLQSSTAKVDADGKVAKAVAADSAESATKAEQDGAGNVIISTYATKTEVSQKADASTVTDEASAREAGDKTLNDRITAVKEHVLKETGDNYVSKADAAVQDAGVVKADKKIGENVTALGKGLYDETAARIGADAAQDKVIKQVNDNLVASVNTINKNVADGFTALNQAGANEAAAREAKDNELNERITNEANAIHDEIKAGDKVLDDRITNVKEYLEKQTSDNYVSKADAAVQDGAVVKAANTIGENVTNLDAALAKETAARLGADKAQDKVIEQVNQNMVDGFNTINKNMSDGFTALSQADANELAGRMAADTKLVEATNGGLSLDNDNVLQKTKTKISSTGEVTTSKEAATTLILNKGAANQVKIDSEGVTVGTSSTQMDAEGFTAGGHDYDAAGAALMSDGRIKGANGAFTVDENGNVASKATITGETVTDGKGASMSNGTVTGKTLTDGKAAISNGNIKTNGGFIRTGGGNINTQGGALRTKGGNINAGSGTITGNKLTDGVASLQNGNLSTTGNINVHDIVATGNIKGNAITGTSLNTQGGDINGGAITGTTINGTTGTFGSLSTTGNASVGGTLTTNGITNTGNATTDTLTVNHNATVGGNLGVTGDITGKSLNVGTGDIKGGQITGTGLDVGAGTIKTTGAVETGTLTTTGNATIGGDLDVKGDLSVEGEFNAKTLSSKLDENNYTTINGGKTQSMNLKLDAATGETKSSASTFDENGSNAWAKDDDSIGKSTVTADGISQKLSDTGDNPTVYAERTMSQGTDKKYSMVDTVKDGDKTNVASQTASESSSVVSGKDGENNYKSYITQNLKKILQKIEDGDGNVLTSTEQTETDITNTAEKGTIANNAQNIINHASENMTNTVGKNLETTVGGNKNETVTGTSTETVTGKKTENYNGGLETTVTGEEKHTVNGSQTNSITGDQVNTIGGKQTTTVTGDVTEDYKANLSTTVGGSQTTTVTGDSSLTAENINNTAKNKITNKALDVETEAKSSIVNKVSNDAGSNTSTQLSYETKEEMSANGKTASYLRGAAEEKSQLTDGAKKTTIDTVAGQTNTNITDGTNTSNNLQKADQVASSVKNGDNQTVSNQDAESLASSATDGTNTTVANQNAKSFSSAATDGANTSVVSQDAKSINSSVTDGTNSTGIRQDAQNIALSANNGTIVASAKNISNTASETLSNSAKNINNTAAEKLSNSAADIENKASKSILNQVGENTSWKMTDGTVLESIKGADGQTNTITDTADSTVQNVKNGSNELTSTTSSTNADLTINNGSSAYTKVNTATGNKETVKEGENLASTNLTKDGFNVYAKDENGHNTIINNASGTTQTIQTDDEHLNVTTKTVGSSEEKLTSGSSVIDVLKSFDDNGNPAATSSVTDGTNTSEVKQTASEVAASAKNISNTATDKITSQIGDGSKVKSEMTADGITNTAKGGTIYNKSKDILNEVSGDILNFAGGEIGNSATKITNLTGDNTVTSDTKGTTFENKAHSTAIEGGSVTKTTISGNTLETGKATMDYAEVLKDLGVRGNAVVDGTLEVGGKSTFKDDVTMEKNLDVEGTTTTDKLVVDNGATIKGGATVTGGTTTDTLHVTSTSTFDGKATFKDIVTMEKDLSVGGNATVAGDVTANSYKVGDKTYIDKDGINANNQVIRNVGQGNISEGSTDAVSGGQLYETNTRVSGLETRMGTVETKVDKLDGKIDKVGANAAAMANLHPLEFDEDSKWNVAAAVGSSGSETASAVGVFYRPNENVMVNASAAMGTGENMFGGGVSLRLGHGGNKAKEAQMKAAAAENKELRAKVDDLTARMDALLSVLNPNMSKDFPDVPENHWAYEAVSRLAGNGIVEGYEDGKYHGERQMTRYEMAEIIYNALSKGAKAEKKLVEEFRPELQAMAAQKKA